MVEIKLVDDVPQIRVFDYLHTSCPSVKSDSNFLTHRFIYKYINRYYPHKFHFYLTYHASDENRVVLNELARKEGNVTPVPIKYHSTNAIFRNALDWESLSTNCPDVDILFCNTPEVNFEILSFFISKGNYAPLMSYSHWFPSLVTPPIYANYLKHQTEQLCIDAKYFYNYILAHKNYNNSKWGTKLIKKSFEILPDPGWNAKITSRIHPLYLTVDHEDVDKFKPANLEKSKIPIIVFNHRTQVYTGFTFFMEAMEKLIALRPELKFKIFLTGVGERELTSKFNIPDEYYLSKGVLNYPDYIRTLWQCDIQLGTHTGDNQWSMSFLDGMFANLVPFYRKDIYFDEMVSGLTDMDEYSFKDEDDFIQKLVFMLSNIEYFRAKNKRIYDHFREHWTWDTLIHPWVAAFKDTYQQTRITETPKFSGVMDLEFPLRWQELKKFINISDQRNNNTYRNTFKAQFPVKEDMTNTEIVFYKKDQPIMKTTGFFK